MASSTDGETEIRWRFAEEYARWKGGVAALTDRANVSAELVGLHLQPLTDSEWNDLACALLHPRTRASLRSALDKAGDDFVKRHFTLAVVVKGQNPNRAFTNAQMLSLGLKPPSDEMHDAIDEMLRDPKMREIVAKVSKNLENPEILNRVVAAIRGDQTGTIH